MAVPVGYVYSEAKILFHSCDTDLKMKSVRKNPDVCLEVDESLSDTSTYKSIVACV